MLTILSEKNADEWNRLVKSFGNWDVYYLVEYASSFKLHGDGEPLLLYYEDAECRFCYVVMKRDIAECVYFKETLQSGKYYDFETPYGYGGPLTEGTISEKSQKIFSQELFRYCEKESVVSQFVRFHPILRNQDALPLVIETRYMRETIYIDTSSEEVIIANMDSKNRNMVRKAIKNGVSIIQRPISEYSDFLSMYEETMLKDNADTYYTFQKNYFESLKKMNEHAVIFYSMLDGKPISGAIMYYNDYYMHYHLAGTYTECRKYSPGNLLLYEASRWACHKGISIFHLGGGMSPNDSLFFFKKQFNKYGKLPFTIGRTVFNNDVYKQLCILRKKSNAEFNENNNFFIQYRY